MLFDAITYRDYVRRTGGDRRGEAVRSFVEFIEKRLGVSAIYPLGNIPYGTPELVEPYRTAQLLEACGMVASFQRIPSLPDEPQLRRWVALGNHPDELLGGGTAVANDREAFLDCIAATLEHAAETAFTATLASISLVSGKRVPSGSNPTGIARVAASPLRDDAHREALLRIIADDTATRALSQGTPLQRLTLAPLRAGYPRIKQLLERCDRYGLDVRAGSLPTDAPTHVVSVVVEDASGHAPHLAYGRSAHRLFSTAFERALLQALNARSAYRESKTPDEQVIKDAIRLDSIIGNTEMQPEAAVFEDDTATAHLTRLLAWCRTHGYECAATPLGSLPFNPTRWHIERVTLVKK